MLGRPEAFSCCFATATQLGVVLKWCGKLQASQTISNMPGTVVEFLINISFYFLISFWSAVWSFVWGMAQQRTAWIWHSAEARGFATLPEFNVRNLICLLRKYGRSETDQAFWCQCSTGSRYQASVPGMVLYVLYCFVGTPGHVWSATSRDIGAGRFSETNGCVRRICTGSKHAWHAKAGELNDFKHAATHLWSQTVSWTGWRGVTSQEHVFCIAFSTWSVRCCSTPSKTKQRIFCANHRNWLLLIDGSCHFWTQWLPIKLLIAIM